MRRPVKRALALVSAVVAILAGCGGSESKGGETSGEQAPPRAASCGQIVVGHVIYRLRATGMSCSDARQIIIIRLASGRTPPGFECAPREPVCWEGESRETAVRLVRAQREP